MIKNKKFFIGSGCSYGKVAFALNQWKEYLNIDDDVIIIDLQQDSQSSEYSADSIIHTCNKLLNEGVDSNNIFVVNEWTTFDRIQYVFPDGIIQESIKKEKTEINTEIYNCSDAERGFLNELINLRMYCFDNGNKMQIQLIDGMCYVNPSHLCLDDYKNTSFYEWSVMFQKHSESINNEKLITNYINNILRLQYYLKSKNIDYNFHFMNSQLSQFVKDSYNNIYHKQIDFYINKNGNFLPNKNAHRAFIQRLDKRYDVQNVYTGIKSKFEDIDFDKFWLYENNGYRFAGIDEWTFDMFDDFGYVATSIEFENVEHRQFFIPKYNNHPNPICYFIIGENLLKDCKFISYKPNSIKEIKEIIRKDLNSENKENIFFPTAETIEQILKIKITNKLI